MATLFICTVCYKAIQSDRSFITKKWRRVSRDSVRIYYQAARQRGDLVKGAICPWCRTEKDYPDLPIDITTPPPDSQEAA